MRADQQRGLCIQLCFGGGELLFEPLLLVLAVAQRLGLRLDLLEHQRRQVVRGGAQQPVQPAEVLRERALVRFELVEQLLVWCLSRRQRVQVRLVLVRPRVREHFVQRLCRHWRAGRLHARSNRWFGDQQPQRGQEGLDLRRRVPLERAVLGLERAQQPRADAVDGVGRVQPRRRQREPVAAVAAFGVGRRRPERREPRLQVGRVVAAERKPAEQHALAGGQRVGGARAHVGVQRGRNLGLFGRAVVAEARVDLAHGVVDKGGVGGRLAVGGGGHGARAQRKKKQHAHFPFTRPHARVITGAAARRRRRPPTRRRRRRRRRGRPPARPRHRAPAPCRPTPTLLSRRWAAAAHAGQLGLGTGCSVSSTPTFRRAVRTAALGRVGARRAAAAAGPCARRPRARRPRLQDGRPHSRWRAAAPRTWCPGGNAAASCR